MTDKSRKGANEKGPKKNRSTRKITRGGKYKGKINASGSVTLKGGNLVRRGEVKKKRKKEREGEVKSSGTVTASKSEGKGKSGEKKKKSSSIFKLISALEKQGKRSIDQGATRRIGKGKN